MRVYWPESQRAKECGENRSQPLYGEREAIVAHAATIATNGGPASDARRRCIDTVRASPTSVTRTVSAVVNTAPRRRSGCRRRSSQLVVSRYTVRSYG